MERVLKLLAFYFIILYCYCCKIMLLIYYSHWSIFKLFSKFITFYCACFTSGLHSYFCFYYEVKIILYKFLLLIGRKDMRKGDSDSNRSNKTKPGKIKRDQEEWETTSEGSDSEAKGKQQRLLNKKNTQRFDYNFVFYWLLNIKNIGIFTSIFHLQCCEFYYNNFSATRMISWLFIPGSHVSLFILIHLFYQ